MAVNTADEETKLLCYYRKKYNQINKIIKKQIHKAESRV